MLKTQIAQRFIVRIISTLSSSERTVKNRRDTFYVYIVIVFTFQSMFVKSVIITIMLKPKTKFSKYNYKINGHFAVPEKAMGKGGKSLATYKSNIIE